MIISASSNIVGGNSVAGSSLDTIISITAQDILNVKPTLTTPDSTPGA